MTDRHSGYIVILERDLREDDAKATLDAIQQIKGVLEVTPHVAGINDVFAGTRERIRIWQEISKIFDAGH